MVIRCHRRLGGVELRYVDGIVRIRAVCDIGNGLAAIIEAIVGQADCISDFISIFCGNGHSAIIDGGIAHRDRSVIGQVEILSKLDFHYTGSAINIDTDVVIRQSTSCATLDIQALVEFLEKDVLLFFRNGLGGLAIDSFRFGLSGLVVIAGILLAVIQSGNELNCTCTIVTVFQTIKLIGRALIFRICRVRRQIRIFIFQISDAIADCIVDISRFLARVIVQSNIAACILIDAQDDLTLVIICVRTIVFYDRYRLAINLDGFFDRSIWQRIAVFII